MPTTPTKQQIPDAPKKENVNKKATNIDSVKSNLYNKFRKSFWISKCPEDMQDKCELFDV
tara:strand:+ start:95 stop:274 length:180 start_codon:yes stop_codon:yes gene_type:complete